MKSKIILLLLGVYSFTPAFAQTDSIKANNENHKYKWGCAVAINSVEAQIGDPQWDSWGYAKGNFSNFGDIKNKSISMSIVPKYFISNAVLLRFEFGMTKINLTNFYDNNAHVSSSNPQSHSIINQTIEQKIYRYIPGIQWNFMKKKFIESYCGLIVSYLHYNDMHYQNRLEALSLPSDSLTGGFDDKATATGGFATGIGAFAGFNIYLQKHISIGAEFSSALLYYKIGGHFGGESTTLASPSTTVTYAYSTSSYRGFQFSKILSSFNISFWFN